MHNNVLNESLLNTNKIIYGSTQSTEDSKYLATKIWYQFDCDCTTTLFTQTYKMTIHEIGAKGYIILRFASEQDANLYEKCDQKTIEFVKSSGLIQKYKLKNIKLKSIANELWSDGQKLIVLRLPISNTSQPIFFDPNKQPIKSDEINKYMQKGKHVKVILEHHSIIIDVDKSEIATNIIVRQVRFYHHLPQIIELSEYSFIDSDSEEEQIVLSSQQAKRIVDVTQTECLNATSELPADHDDSNNDDDDEIDNEGENIESESDDEVNLATSDNDSELSVDTTTFLSHVVRGRC